MDQGDCMECPQLQGKDWTHLLQKAVALVKHPICQGNVKRHLKIINECIIVSQYGYYIQELPVVMELVDALRSLSCEEYQAPLIELLKNCGMPPRMKKTSDLLVYAKDIKEYFSWFGYLLVCVYDFDQQQQIVNSLIELLSDDYPNHKQYLSLSIRRDKAYESRLCGILGEFLEIANDDIYVKIMDIILLLVEGSEADSPVHIAKMAMSADFPDAAHWSRYVFIPSTTENYDFLNLMLMCIAYFPHVLSSNKIIEECRIVPGLIKLMTNTQTTKWPMKYHCCLVNLCLDVFRCLSDCTSDEFLESGGPYSVLKAISLIRSTPELNIHLLTKCVEVLNHFCLKSRCVKESVWFNNGIFLLLSVCEDILNSPILSLQKQNLLSVTFNLLHKIVKSETEMKATMPWIMSYLRRYYSPNTEDSVMDPSVMCFVLKLLWEIFLKSKVNTKHFVKDGGVYLLLDIIYVSCFSVKLVALGALVDLCFRAKCIPYLITWRKDEKRIVSMLMDIFKKENHRLHVKVGPYGEIVDTRLPIMGILQFYQTHCQCGKSGGNPSIADLFISCRPKVYCLLQILNNIEADTTEVANDFYKLYDEQLSIEDQVTLLVAENFLALKMSEEWQELCKEFEKMGFEPTPADKTVISSMIEVTQKWGEMLQDMQKDIIEYNTDQERIKEQELYQQLRDARLSDALDGLFRLKRIARTSEKMFKVSTKYNLSHTVESNLEDVEIYGTLHRMYPSNMSIALIGAPLINYINTHSSMEKASKDIHFLSPANSNTLAGRNQVRISFDIKERDAYCSKDMLHGSGFF